MTAGGLRRPGSRGGRRVEEAGWARIRLWVWLGYKLGLSWAA